VIQIQKSSSTLVCDSSALISLTDSCFIHSLYFLRKKSRASFLIPPSVEFECVDHPFRMKMHAIHALRLKRAINDGVVSIMPVSDPGETEKIKWMANNIFYSNGTPLRILHEGETEVLALASELGVENILVDERTTRMLAEDPDSLHKHLEEEFHRPISVNDENLSQFQRLTKNMKFFRSSELLLLAYEKGYFADYKELENDAIEAALYKLKYAGCAVGFGEISKYVSEHMKE
jgi:hypothetical protein